ncbi:Uncharacterised protein [Streptococcus pneumoniae]|uniref:serine hydrolase n=1 Tax=Bacillus cereus group TaxID=86661 RepID=UPI0005DE95F5|nr:serine hydrolase [Bacillus cereus]MDZ4589759.1 serine hydrolase [Bacillus cereus]CGG67456.1 Uncharacterised protein [Streptococcus pneumoniae]COS37581.1 Uncharacterised protein [Streptococcus pneumoniae]COS72172.1 Uncharacterised protein [Streptococcus pneumoniae]
METVINKIKEVQSNYVGMAIYSTKNNRIVASYNSELNIPLASAAKLVIGFVVTQMVKENKHNWNDILHYIKFNPHEDSAQLYPHLQGRTSLTLSQAVEVMIACHDSYVAQSVVMHCGGWDAVKMYAQTYFSKIHIQENARDEKNVGELSEVLALFIQTFQGYKSEPELWEPIISGMVRQQGEYEEIPYYHITHMTGGLLTATINIGIIGMFNELPLLYVIGGKDLPNRGENKEVDEAFAVVLKYIYKEYSESMLGVSD